MFLRISSDLHSEFWDTPEFIKKVIPPLDTDRETVLCLAGDVGLFGKYEKTVNFSTQAG